MAMEIPPDLKGAVERFKASDEYPSNSPEFLEKVGADYEKAFGKVKSAKLEAVMSGNVEEPDDDAIEARIGKQLARRFAPFRMETGPDKPKVATTEPIAKFTRQQRRARERKQIWRDKDGDPFKWIAVRRTKAQFANFMKAF